MAVLDEMLERWEAALIVSSMKEIIEYKRISRRSNVLLHGLSGIVEWRFYVYEEFIFEIQSKMQNMFNSRTNHTYKNWLWQKMRTYKL